MAKILSDRAKNKNTKEKNKILPLMLEQRQGILSNPDISLFLDAAEAYRAERNASTCYRITSNINVVASNVLLQPTGTNSYGLVEDLRNYDIEDDVFEFTVDDVLKRENGWYYVLTGDTLNTCDRLYIEPTPDKFSVLGAQGQHNYEMYVTYPERGDSALEFAGVPLSDGLRVYSLSNVVYKGKTVVKLFTSIPHNLSVNDAFFVFNADSTGFVGEYNVFAVGDELGDYPEHCLLVDTLSTYPDPSVEKISIKKSVNGELSSYYLRFFKTLTVEQDGIIYPASLSKNIYADNVFNCTIEKDVDISNLTDALGRPLTELYFTAVKKRVASTSGETYWSQVSSGIETIFAFSDYDINTLVTTNIDNSIESDITATNGLYFGDIVEFNALTSIETVLVTARHRFNSIDRDGNGNYEGYFYVPHHKIEIGQFSENLSETFSADEAPVYAKNVKGKYIWREQKSNSDVDNESIPFLNGCHYVFRKIDLFLKRQDPCVEYDLGNYIVSGDCVSFEVLEVKDENENC